MSIDYHGLGGTPSKIAVPEGMLRPRKRKAEDIRGRPLTLGFVLKSTLRGPQRSNAACVQFGTCDCQVPKKKRRARRKKMSDSVSLHSPRDLNFQFFANVELIFVKSSAKFCQLSFKGIIKFQSGFILLSKRCRPSQRCGSPRGSTPWRPAGAVRCEHAAVRAPDSRAQPEAEQLCPEVNVHMFS